MFALALILAASLTVTVLYQSEVNLGKATFEENGEAFKYTKVFGHYFKVKA